MSERPRVFYVMPSNGVMRSDAAYALELRGRRAHLTRGIALGSILDHCFNLAWATALNYAGAGAVDWFLMHHSDIEIRTHGWLDIMLAEAEARGAAVLSAAQAIKDDGGGTSTAAEGPDPWNPRQLSLRGLARLPETFGGADLGAPLLVNTGLMLVDVRRPEFHEAPRGELAFRFQSRTRVVRGPDGQLKAQVRPEDWEFSRACHAAGLPVYCTRKVECLHHGDRGFPNRPPAVSPAAPDPSDRWFDFGDVYDAAVRRVPDGGTLVEVGCWRGRSLSHLLGAARASGKRLEVFGVDHFRGSPGQAAMVAEARDVDLEAECRRRCDAADYRYTLLAEPSARAAARFGDGSLDFVFIDAGHDFDSVAADIRAWLPKVRPGGVLAGHDFDPLTDPDVPQAVCSLLPAAGQAGKAGRCWWYDKPQEVCHATP